MNEQGILCFGLEKVKRTFQIEKSPML